MTGDAQYDNHASDTAPEPAGGLDENIARRSAELRAHDEQIHAAMPKPDVVDAARQPGLRLPQVLQTYADGYADRPALGWRARTLTTDAATDRTTSRLLLRFVQAAKIGTDDDIPHVSASLIRKHSTDLEHLGLLTRKRRSR